MEEVGKLEGRAATSRNWNSCVVFFLRILGLTLLEKWGLEQVRVKVELSG